MSALWNDELEHFTVIFSDMKVVYLTYPYNILYSAICINSVQVFKLNFD